MKKLIAVTLGLLLSVSALGAEITCAKATGDGFYRPVSPLAIDIAKHLKVKTCRGLKFKSIAKKMNQKIVKRAMTRSEQDLFEKSITADVDVSIFKRN